MRIIAVVSQKGGAGKSTLVRHLSVVAAETGPVYVVDRDEQATTREFFERRQGGDAPLMTPEFLDLGSTSLTEAARGLRRKEGTLFVDTRPETTEPVAEAARVADLVIVPVRPSPDDLSAVRHTLTMLRRLDRRAVIVVNAAKNSRRAEGAFAYLARWGIPVCPAHLSDRAVFQDLSLAGRGVTEGQGAAARAADQEIRAVWAWILDNAEGGAR